MTSRSQANNNQATSAGEFVKKVPIFQGLEQAARDEIAAMMQYRTFGAGMTLFHQDMPGMTLYIMAEGFVRLYSIGQTGQEFTYYLYGPMDIFGELSLLDNGYHSATCTTVTPIKTWIISKEHLFNIFQKYPTVTMQLMGTLSRRARAATRKSEVMAFQDVQGRLAYELLVLAEKASTQTAEGLLMEIPLNQNELASMVGATRESVNKALAMFKSHNLVKVSGTTILISDKQGLEKIIAERGR
jgi:CRP-like cAMP-binding protein